MAGGYGERLCEMVRKYKPHYDGSCRGHRDKDKTNQITFSTVAVFIDADSLALRTAL